MKLTINKLYGYKVCHKKKARKYTNTYYLALYEKAQLENESIDDIFAEVEDIEDIPIISIDSKEEQ